MARVGRPQERSIVLSEGEREELERISRSRSAAHSLMRRVQIILASADGEPNVSIAARLGVSHPTVCHWRKKWFEQGLVGMYGAERCDSSAFSARGDREPMTRRRWPNSCAPFLRASLRAARIGRSVQLRLRQASPRARLGGCSSSSGCSRIAPRPSSSPPTPEGKAAAPFSRRQGQGHRRLVSEPTGQGRGPVCRREIPDPGARAHTTHFAARPGLHRGGNP